MTRDRFIVYCVVAVGSFELGILINIIIAEIKRRRKK